MKLAFIPQEYVVYGDYIPHSLHNVSLRSCCIFERGVGIIIVCCLVPYRFLKGLAPYVSGTIHSKATPTAMLTLKILPYLTFGKYPE